MLKWIFAGLLLSSVGLATYLYSHLGFYKSAQVIGVEEQGFWMLAKSHKGAYHQISPYLTEIEAAALKAGITCVNAYALFLDDPSSMAEDRLRSEIGCILAQELTELPPELVEKKLSVKRWEPEALLHISFDGSPAISPFKVYSVAEEWFEEKRQSKPTEVLEVYALDVKGKLTTHYYFPTKKGN